MRKAGYIIFGVLFFIIIYLWIFQDNTPTKNNNYLNYNINMIINGFGRPDIISADWTYHKKLCKYPYAPPYIKVNNNSNIPKIVDSLVNISDYCCDLYKKQIMGGNIIFLYHEPYISLKIDKFGRIINQKSR